VIFSLFGYGLFFMKTDIKGSGYWIEKKPWGIYKLTNCLDWHFDLKWWSFTIWIESID
jgi:hypothetical protein